jgi:transcriptional regulator with XRE-family HTH domain
VPNCEIGESKNMDDIEFKKRTGWAINRISADRHLGNIEIAKLLSSSATTVSNYRTEKNGPKTAFIISLCKEFGYNQDWFMTGAGEPFVGAREKYPEICGPKTPAEIKYDQITETVHHHIKDAQMQYNPNADALFKSDQKINIEEAMGKTYKVLSAGTALSVALYMNIQQFAAALDTGQELRECKETMVSLQSQIDDLRQQVDRLSAVPGTTEGQGDASESEKVA